MVDIRIRRKGFLKLSSLVILGSVSACSEAGSQEIEPVKAGASPGSSQQPAASSTPTLRPTDKPAPTSTQEPTATQASTPTQTTSPDCRQSMECGDAVLDSEGAAERKSVYNGVNYIITALCLRCGECVNNCNDQVIAPGDPPEQWPTFYINRDDCVSCAACVPACPYGAIFRESDVPAAYVAKGGEVLNRPGLRGYHTVRDAHGQRVRLNTTCRLKPGQVVDLTVDIQGNYDFFDIGPGYSTQELLAPGWIDISEPIYASDESFEDIVIDSAMPVLVMYYAAWCPPSQMLMPVIKVIAYDYSGDLGVILIDMDQNPRWAQYYGITSTPTLLFFSQGELKSRFDLALPESMLRKAVDQFLCTLG